MRPEDTEKNPLEKAQRADIPFYIIHSYDTFLIRNSLICVNLWGGFLTEQVSGFFFSPKHIPLGHVFGGGFS